jgi:hypothetical protein
MAYTKYSLTPSSNTAAPPDGAPEGMLPSAVNDTMRDMMSQIRDCGDGIRGGTYTMTAPVITGGSITGVALSGNTLTNPVITGGSINNAPIGATTASTGAFSTLAYTGTLTGGTGVINLGSGQFYKDASGNVGINTASPTQPLDVNGIIKTNTGLFFGSQDNFLYESAVGTVTVAIEGAVTQYLDFVSKTDGPMVDAVSGQLLLGTGGTERMRIASNGIITMSAYGAGAATFSASGVISSVSDETWKIKDGVPTNPDEMLQKLQPGYWFYNEEKAPIFGTDRQLGFYAQNVNEAIGNEAAPTPEEGKPWGYYDRSVLAVTVMSLKNALNTIQEQQALIESLTTRLSALEAK